MRNETTGGFLMLGAAVLALVWANVASGSYTTLSETTIGPSAIHLDLDLAHWAADGLLAIFFFVVGLELKRELIVGSLRRPAAAALPIIAAICGMVGPILVFTLFNTIGDGDMRGWAVPTATDIAFALAVLAVIGSRLPAALRAFLLTLAVVDDLLAITIIAVAFTSGLEFLPLAGAAAILVVYYLLQRRDLGGWWIYVPMGVVAWALMHESGVHATVVGVAFGLLTRAHHREGEREAPAERVEHQVRPYSAVICVPIYAFFAAGVTISGESLREAFTEALPLGVTFGLVVGKGVGIFLGTYLAAKFSKAQLSDRLAWSDIFGLGLLAGIGFTVSLLIGELAFRGDEEVTDMVKMAVLLGSLISAVLATFVLGARNRAYRTIHEEETRDSNLDGIPDVYQDEGELEAESGEHGSRSTVSDSESGQ
ncbi:Na+/H+ antiporter NhaA [Phytoactinopolyspora halotolerans]|nr:Na+/H+ antiporter NhaA [Phytoactinopolyspora halotolerans]